MARVRDRDNGELTYLLSAHDTTPDPEPSRMATLEFIALVAIGLITIGAGLTLLQVETQNTSTPATRRVLALVIVANLFIAALLLLDVM